MIQTMQTIFQRAWEQLQAHALSVLPGLMAGTVIMSIGVLLGWLLGLLADRLLRAAEVDTRADRLGLAGTLETIGVLSTVRLLARAVQWAIIVLSALLAIHAISPAMASLLIVRALGYMPHLIVGLAILAAGALVSRFAARSVLIAAVNAQLPAARLIAVLARSAIMLLAAAIALEHLGIGRTTVLAGFTIVFGGAIFACALALALGSQDLVRQWIAEALEARRGPRRKTAIHHW